MLDYSTKELLFLKYKGLKIHVLTSWKYKELLDFRTIDVTLIRRQAVPKITAKFLIKVAKEQSKNFGARLTRTLKKNVHIFKGGEDFRIDKGSIQTIRGTKC